MQTFFLTYMYTRANWTPHVCVKSSDPFYCDNIYSVSPVNFKVEQILK